MFAGTVVHRWQHGQIGRAAGATALAMVTLALLGSQRTYATTAAVAGTFLFAFVMRNRAMPRVLTGLGRISYSLYLTHVILLFAIPELGTRPPAQRVVAGLTYLAAALGLAWLSYRMVELRGQALGRAIAGRTAPPPIPATLSTFPGTRRGENRRESV